MDNIYDTDKGDTVVWPNEDYNTLYIDPIIC